jgi:integrase
MTPLRTYSLNKVISRWDLSQPVVLLQAAIVKTGQQGLMRGAEVTSGLKACDVQWRRKYRLARFHLLRTKRGRSGAGQFVTVAHVDNDRFSATKLLRRLWAILDLERTPEGFVFPAISRGKIDMTKAFSAVALRALVKRIAREAGFSDTRFGNHSLRAGGTTDLLAAGVPDIMVQKMGRWESETYKIYFRDDRAVAEAVAKGFNRVARSVVW